MPTESEAYITIVTKPNKAAIYIFPCSRERAEQIRKQATRGEN